MTNSKLLVIICSVFLVGLALGVLATRFAAFETLLSKFFPYTSNNQSINPDYPFFDYQYGSVSPATIKEVTPEGITFTNTRGVKATFPLGKNFTVTMPGADNKLTISSDVSKLKADSSVTVLLDLEEGRYTINSITILPQ